MKYSLVTIRPQGFPHSNGFRELQESVGWALAALGHESNITENAFANEGRNIVFGAELVSPDSTLPPNTTIYNLEQDSHPAFAQVLRLGKQVGSVWEYSAVNLPHWKECGVDSIHVPFGYTRNLSRIPKSFMQDIDVFFSGWLTERRKKILDELRVHGLNVVAVDTCYGGGRDNLISRAKVCLNINHDGRNRTNIQRLSFWMANSKCIVSETSSDMDYYDDLLPSIVVERYDGLVEICRKLVDQPSRIERIGQDAWTAISNRDYTSYIAKALESQPVNPILERYEQGCREGDMKEYLPWLRANARGMCLEIGTRDGASTSAILLALERNDGVLTSVDISDGPKWEHPRWVFQKKDSRELKIGDNELDFVLIDGDHSREGFLADLHNCYRWVKNGGMIAVHDVSPPMTYEDFGGDFPSVAVGQEFEKFCKGRWLTSFYLPGEQGMGVLVVRK